MAIVWDKVTERTYEAGLDRGVLYLPDGSGVAWNGLVSVDQTHEHDETGVYYDGVKVSEIVSLGEFKGSLTAYTYPDEFSALVGYSTINCGVSLGEQQPQRFSISYRTMIGDSASGLDAYKIHIIYNLMASPGNVSYKTLSNQGGIDALTWNLTSLAEEVEGYRPTAEIVIDSRHTDVWLLEEIEEMLYGGEFTEPNLPSINEVILYIENWFRFKVIAGDGLWTAYESREGMIEVTPDGLITIDVDSAVYISSYEYSIGDLYCVSPSANIIDITNLGDYWTAETPYDSFITVSEETGIVVISNATLTFSGPEMYAITDTPADANFDLPEDPDPDPIVPDPPDPPPVGTVPTPPIGVLAVAGNAKADVSWGAPTDNGGSAITRYRVTPYVGSTAQNTTIVSQEFTSASITGLANNTAYTFKVQAENANGWSDYSTASSPVTPTAPPVDPPGTVSNPPTNVVGSSGDARVTVSWTAPTNTGGLPLTNYRVTPYIGTAGQTPVTVAATLTSTLVTGLTNGTAYTFKVQAENSKGWSAYSTASAPVTPSAPIVPVDPLDPTIPTGYVRDWVTDLSVTNGRVLDAAGAVRHSNFRSLWFIPTSRHGETKSVNTSNNFVTSGNGMFSLLATDAPTGDPAWPYSTAYEQTVTSFNQPLTGRYEILMRTPLSHSEWSCWWLCAGSADTFEIDIAEMFTAQTPGRGNLVFHSPGYYQISMNGSSAWNSSFTYHRPETGSVAWVGPKPGSTMYWNKKSFDIADPANPDARPWVKYTCEIEKVTGPYGYTVEIKVSYGEYLCMTYRDPFDPNTGSGRDKSGTYTGNKPRWVAARLAELGGSENGFWNHRFDSWIGGPWIGECVDPVTGAKIEVYNGRLQNGQPGATSLVPSTLNRWPLSLDIKYMQRLVKTTP
jgi:hypothetical protein